MGTICANDGDIVKNDHNAVNDNTATFKQHISVGEREEEEGKVVVDTHANDPLIFPFQKASANFRSRMDTIYANDDISVRERKEEEGKVEKFLRGCINIRYNFVQGLLWVQSSP